MKLTIKELKKVISQTIQEIDDQFYDQLFDKQRYDVIARQLVNKFPKEYSKKNWKKIIDDYVRTRQDLSGRKINKDLLFDSISELVRRDYSLKSQHLNDTPKIIPEEPY